MASLNKVMLIGRVIADPKEARTLPNTQSTVVSFRFAVGRSKKRPDGTWENDPNPLYIDCDVFSRPDDRRRLTDVVTQYVRKGSQMYIEGTLRFEEWTDRDNPEQKRSKHKVVVSSIEFIGTAPGGEGGGGGDDDMGSQAPAPRAAAPRSTPPARNNAPQGNSGGRGNTPPAKSGGYSNYNPMDDGPSHNGGGDDDIPF